MRRTIFLILIVLLLAAGAFLYPAASKIRVVVLEQQPPGELVHLEQGWNESQRRRFHHTAQGTRLLRYEWFLALEQPCLSLFSCAPLADNAYLARFGFLVSKADPQLNPDGLPVGFARQTDFYDPETRETYPVVGLTCAACHTGELSYGKYAVRIEGGPAKVELAEFQKAVGLAMAFTKLLPFRYGRFEQKVLGPHASDDQRARLKEQFSILWEAAKAEKSAADQRHIYEIPAGFGRTDALTRIGNQVFAVNMKIDANLAPANAPVRFPQLWDASWFNWVQYNSSIADPLVRNIGEALGVRAPAKLYGADAGKFESSVYLAGLQELEALLAGPAPYQGLAPPKWPAVFPPLDRQKAARGAQLYKQHCQGCHLPPVEELRADLASKQPVYWTENYRGTRLLRVTDVEAGYVGTDPHATMDFMNRTADTGALHLGRLSAGAGLEKVIRGIEANLFAKLKLPPEHWEAGGVAVRSEAIYKARPLNGIWAVAPYVHNGSVPNLYQMLSPHSERSPLFWVGSKRFDPVRVGYDTSELPGGYQFDVTKPGNSNHGHEFKDGPRGNGVIGPSLSPDDRWALIEYLKTI